MSEHEKTAPPDDLDELVARLEALEAAYKSWDLCAMSGEGAAVRTALELFRRSGYPADAAASGRLAQVMALTRRCQELAAAGELMSRALTRLERLTYGPPAADVHQETPGETAAAVGGAHPMRGQDG